MTLEKYKSKRDFKDTPEPYSGEAERGEGELVFVVQRHLATRLHYDLRLEMEGVLKSWAIPKGPSMNPKDKRLAMMTEDHPYRYKDFEGEIPEGNYGAGLMEIWDSGTYQALGEEGRNDSEEKLLEGLKDGNLKFILNGDILKGEFALVKINANEEGNQWLLIKKKDEFAVTGKYNSEDYIHSDSQIIKGARSWKKDKPKQARNKKQAIIPEGGIKSKMPHDLKPMLAKLIDKPFDGREYLFELKWDGYRAICEIEKGEVKLYSRNGLPFNQKYPSLIRSLQQLEIDVVLDGEIAVLNENGVPNFQLLQNYKEAYTKDLFYYVFDILYLNGYSLVDLPLIERKKYIQDVIEGLPNIRYSDHILEKGKLLYKEAQNSKVEGIIAKKSASPYRVGRRSGEWLKIKTSMRQEFVVCGYTEPKGSRKHLGSLVLGAYKDGKLVFTGSAGGGFTDSELRATKDKLEPLIRKTSPFNEKVKASSPITWVKPNLVCEVEFAEWTDDNVLRHPVFKGFREDKDAKDVQVEKPLPIEDEKIESKATEMKTEKTKSKKEKAEGNKKEAKPKGPKDAPPGKNKENLKIDGHTLALSNLDKVYFPESGYTKGDIIDYYLTIGKYLLPYLKDRPQSLHRHPNGINEPGFFQKNMGESLPGWMASKEIQSGTDKEINYLLCQDQATLTYMNNLGCIEINPWNSRVQSLDYPDYTIIDLDPADNNTFDEVIETALVVKDILDRAGAECFCKTSGSSGMHIFIPLGAKYDYEQGKNFAHIIAQLTHAELPKLTSIERSPKARPKEIYLDYLQNRKGQTLASVYSVRPRAGATVSTPLLWKEVKPGLHPSQFTIKNMPGRIKKMGDIFKGILGKGIDMAKCLENLE